jgi:hypothetical protein
VPRSHGVKKDLGLEQVRQHRHRQHDPEHYPTALPGARTRACAARQVAPSAAGTTRHGPGPGRHPGTSTGTGGGCTHALRFHAPRVSIHSRTVALSCCSLFICPQRQPDRFFEARTSGSIRAAQASEHREASARTAQSFRGRRTTRSHTGLPGPCTRGSGRAWAHAHCTHASRSAAHARGGTCRRRCQCGHAGPPAAPEKRRAP